MELSEISVSHFFRQFFYSLFETFISFLSIFLVRCYQVLIEGGTRMEPVSVTAVQKELDRFSNEDIYIHLETTNGAYATHHNENFFSSGAYIRNARIQYIQGKITGEGPYRIGLKMPIGWVYAEGITHYEKDEDRLLLAGHDYEGKLAVALQISRTPFD